jgi:large conductance mechanosensitive channel
MLKGFKDFALKGNLIEVAVGLVMALAIFALVQALIESLITPLIGAVVGEPDFGDLTFTINGSEFFYGNFINALITFLSVAAAVYFFMVVPYERYKQHRGITSDMRPCPECTTEIPIAATRCPSCTAQVPATPACGPRSQPSLLPQPRGFKGIGFVHHTFDSYDPSAAEGEQDEEPDVTLDPACPAGAVKRHVAQDRVTSGAEIDRLDACSFPLLEEATHVLADLVRAHGHTRCRERPPNDQYCVRIELSYPAVQVGGPPFVDSPDHLDVLLRHRRGQYAGSNR